MRIFFTYLLLIILINYNQLFSFIETTNLGIIKLDSKTINCLDKNGEDAVYNLLKANVVKVLKSHKIKYNIRYGLIETNWYNYQNKSSKLFITVMPDECQVRIQLQQKALENKKVSNIDPQKIKSDINKLFKE